METDDFKLQDKYTVNFFDEDLKCPAWGTDIFDELYFKCWADLTLDMQASAGVSLIVSVINTLVLENMLRLQRELWEICRVLRNRLFGSARLGQLMLL